MASEEISTNPIDVRSDNMLRVFGERGGVFTTLDPKNRMDAVTYMQCLNDCTGRLDPAMPTGLSVRHVFAHRVQIANEQTGEVSEHVRVVLVTPDRQTYECVSDGIARDVYNLMDLFGLPPWEPPLHLRVIEKKLAGGKRMFKLTFVPDSEESPKVTSGGRRGKGE